MTEAHAPLILSAPDPAHPTLRWITLNRPEAPGLSP